MNKIFILVKNHHFPHLVSVCCYLFLSQEFTRKVLLKEPGKTQAMTFVFCINEGK